MVTQKTYKKYYFNLFFVVTFTYGRSFILTYCLISRSTTRLITICTYILGHISYSPTITLTPKTLHKNINKTVFPRIFKRIYRIIKLHKRFRQQYGTGTIVILFWSRACPNLKYIGHNAGAAEKAPWPTEVYLLIKEKIHLRRRKDQQYEASQFKKASFIWWTFLGY